MSNNTALNSNAVQESYFLIQNKVDVNLKSVNKLGYLGTKSWAKFAGAVSLEPAELLSCHLVWSDQRSWIFYIKKYSNGDF